MKELSIEEKAKRYDEAIKLVNSKWHYKNQPCFIDVSEIFPELKETESECIRKWIINEIKINHHNLDKDNVDFVDKAIAWLEQQNNRNISLLELKAKAYDDAKNRMNYAYNQNRVSIGFISEIFPNLDLYKTQDKTPITHYCCILNYNTGKVYKHCITEDEVNLTTEELLKKYGFKESECSIMYASNNLELELLEN